MYYIRQYLRFTELESYGLFFYADIPSLDFYQRKAENDKRQIYHISSNYLLYSRRGTTRHLLLR